MKELNKDLYKLNEEYLNSQDKFIRLLAIYKSRGIKFNKELNIPNTTTIVTVCELPKLKRRLKSPEWKAYKKEVWRITKEQPLHTLEHIEKRAFRGYHLDHKISVWFGFRRNICPEKIGNISNLRMIPAEENMRKGTRCVFD